jgi:dTDP-glucose 4,6-dehydratase
VDPISTENIKMMSQYIIMESLLVTGALGFIGSNFVNYISNKYPLTKIVILDKKAYCSSLDNVNKTDNIEIIIGDTGNEELVTYILNHYAIDHIIHFAAQTHVDRSFNNSICFTINNVIGTHNLLECSRVYQNRTNGLKKFILISTDEVYGGSKSTDSMYDENAIFDPTNPYAATKASAEHIAKSYYYSYHLPIIITRGNNVYGKQQYPEKVIPRFICRLIRGKKLPIYGTGQNLRYFIHVDDTCSAIETILLKGSIGEVYNISGDKKNIYSTIELAKLIIKLFYSNSDTENIFEQHVEYVEDRFVHDFVYTINSDKLRALGWEPMNTNFDKNIGDLIIWYRNNYHRYENIDL